MSSVSLTAAILMAFAAVSGGDRRDSPPPEVGAGHIEWRIERASSDSPEGWVQFELGYRIDGHSQMYGTDVPLTALDGLSAAQRSATADQSVAFTLHRDAGDFRCAGTMDHGSGEGGCAFTANPGFGPGLARRGVAAPALDQQFELAFMNIGYDYVDELKRQAYATPTPDDLVHAGEHGASLKQLRAFDAAGYRFHDLAALSRVRDHGVSARFIEALRVDGYVGVPAEDLVRLRDHGVGTSYVEALKASGYSKLSVETLVRLRDHGVSTGFVTELRSMGYGALSPDELVRLADHGVRAGFIRTANRDGAHLSPDQLIDLRDRGGRD